MLLTDGTLRIYSLENIADPGEMPVDKLVDACNDDLFYADRTVGYGRQYAAMGVDQRIDRLVRIWAVPVRIGQYAVLDHCDQYEIDNVQSLKDNEGLKVVDLTLKRLEERYDVFTEETQRL